MFHTLHRFRSKACTCDPFSDKKLRVDSGMAPGAARSHEILGSMCQNKLKFHGQSNST